MKSFERIGKTVVALVASAAAGLILGILFYLGGESIGYRYPWGSSSSELRVLWAIQFGLVCGVALFAFRSRKMRIPGRSLYALLILLVPLILAAYVLRSSLWLVVALFGIIAVVMLVAAIPGQKRKITPEQFADELERHLLGTEGKWDWDDTTSLAIADERLERIRWELSKSIPILCPRKKTKINSGA